MTEETKKAPVMRFQGFSDDWEQRKFEEMLDKNDGVRRGPFGSSLKKEIFVENSDYVVYEQQNAIYDNYKTRYNISKEKFDELHKFSLKENDFIMSGAGTIGRISRVPKGIKPGVFNQALIRFRINSELTDPKYFLQFIRAENMQRKLTGANPGSAITNLVPMTEVKNWEIFVPAKAEQIKIGDFFKNLDNTIALHQRKLEKTKALKSAYLSELFPVEGERKPKRRFAGFIDDWKQGTVGEYGYFYYGKSAPKWSVTKDAIIPCVRYGELYTKFGAKIDKVYSYTNISKENLKFSTGNEVLVPRVGEDPLDFANCSWLSIPNVAIGEMISVYNTEENPLFISYYFNSQLRHAFAKRVEGGNVSNLYFTYLENITISIPNKEEQDTIANFLESLDSVVEHHQHKLEKLKNIKQAYLNELFV